MSTTVTPRQRAEAVKLIDAFARKGIRLHVCNGVVKWAAADEEPTAAEQWAINQLAATLKTILTEGDMP